MSIVIKNRSLHTRILRSKQVIFVGASPKHGGTKARKMLTALGVTDTDDSFDALVKVASEDEWQHCVAQLQQLDARKIQERVAIDTLCGTLAGLATSVEIIDEGEKKA